MDQILQFCDHLLDRPDDQLSDTRACPRDRNRDDQPEPVPEIQRQDVENLSNFVQIWTDVVEIEEVMKQFKASDFTDLNLFETTNNLTNVGFFYVHINDRLSPLEFFGLLTKIPWEALRSPGLNQIPYISIAQILGPNSETLSIQLMVLGHFYKFWILINPFHQMSKTHQQTRLLLSCLGMLSILISPGFIKNCQELIESVDLESALKVK